MVLEDVPYAPGLGWRAASTATIAFTGFLAKAFARIACSTEVHGLESFVRLLNDRENVKERDRGLITVSNHLSVIDDPLIWGVLPFRHLCNPSNMRWSLGSYDICFTNPFLSAYFSLGQVLPTHRLAHSVHGGPFQPTVTQCIRLLSSGPFAPLPPYTTPFTRRKPPPALTDPFSSPNSDAQHYTTTGHDSFPSPSSSGAARHAWVHVFPEGKVHQAAAYGVRYFRWGVARLILEAEPCPDVVPIWIEGAEDVMPEARPPPRWAPRLGARVHVTFGERVPRAVWEGFRERWRGLVERVGGLEAAEGGVLRAEELRTGWEAVQLRIEVASAVRDEIMKLRRGRGWIDEDPKAGVVETYAKEGRRGTGRMDDGSWVGDTRNSV